MTMTQTGDLQALRDLYGAIRPDIEARLREFRLLGKNGENAVLFREMCFCICTPQTDAHKSYSAAMELHRTGTLSKGSPEEIASVLRSHGVRFHNTKGAYIVANRRAFLPSLRDALEIELLPQGQFEARNILAKKVRGWGLKEASHFLRNIGFGDELCILDRHILKCLASFRVIEAAPESLPKTLYFDIEARMKDFAQKAGVPLDALDLVFWRQAKGEVFR
jgi:N-glycosylase/DNA lyase